KSPDFSAAISNHSKVQPERPASSRACGLRTLFRPFCQGQEQAFYVTLNVDALNNRVNAGTCRCAPWSISRGHASQNAVEQLSSRPCPISHHAQPCPSPGFSLGSSNVGGDLSANA